MTILIDRHAHRGLEGLAHPAISMKSNIFLPESPKAGACLVRCTDVFENHERTLGARIREIGIGAPQGTNITGQYPKSGGNVRLVEGVLVMKRISEGDEPSQPVLSGLGLGDLQDRPEARRHSCERQRRGPSPRTYVARVLTSMLIVSVGRAKALNPLERTDGLGARTSQRCPPSRPARNWSTGISPPSD